MLKSLLFTLLIVVLVACEPTGDSQQDQQAAQSFFPTFANYQTQGLEMAQDAVLGALTALGIGTGNLPLSLAMYKIDDFVDCYREVGAFDVRLYVERPSNVDEFRLPITGVLIILNQSRVLDNFLPCLTRAPAGLSRPQSVQQEPCSGYGTFQSGGDNISYLYVATDEPLCALWQAHFASLGG